MKEFIEKKLCINYALQIGGRRSMTRAKPYNGTLWHWYNKSVMVWLDNNLRLVFQLNQSSEIIWVINSSK